MLFVLAVLEVHLTGGQNEVLHVILEIVGPLLIAGAAVFAAKTARDSASERQEKQLIHDTERQEEALAHDREMRDRESTRDVIDQAIEAAHVTLDKFKSCEVQVEALQAALGDPARANEVKELHSKVTKSLEEAAKAVPDLGFHGLRIRSRPGADSVADFYKALRENYRKHRDALREGVAPLTPQQQKKIKQIDKEGTQKMAELLAAWHQWLLGAT